MNDRDALLTAIRANPDEDAVRLAYADWEQEHGDEDRAELIRVQCEWWRLKSVSHPNTERGRSETVRVLALTGRTIELATRADGWRKGPTCGRCRGSGYDRHSEGSDMPFPCPHCYGTGDAGCLTRKVGMAPAGRKSDWIHEVGYQRGMKRVHCRAEEVWQSVADHDNNDRAWLPTAWALAVCRHHPDVVELWIDDKPPRNPWPRSGYWWATDDDLPSVITQKVGKFPTKFKTAEEAETRLARETVQWVHSHIASGVPA